MNMDWYFCNGMEDFVVPNDQELPDRLPSPESWSKWGLTVPGNFEASDKCFVVDANLTHDKLKFNSKLCNDAEFESSAEVKDPDSCSIRCGGFSEESLDQAPLSQPQPDYELDDFARFEQMDDIFMSSLLEDLPGSEDLPKPFCFSPEYECGIMPADYLLKDISANGFVSEGMSLEESVLQELEMVTAQLSDQTRICFRDAFYRLANNSKQNPVALNQQGNLSMGTHSPKWTISEEKIRSENKETTESETNTIDRTIANLTFNKMKTNVRDFPVAIPDNSKQSDGTTEPELESLHSQIHYFSQSSVAPSDAEVPFFVHKNSQRMDGHGYASGTDANNRV
ncbi:hypothetical protein CRYUN_Cryun41cG0063300 [Craigia yunnanensis]